ncbi:MAG: hypothetical protein HQK53_18955 [Oligoflexia bacterium]|nr:hypothetical protein [Oligoflexia bacterium]
MKFDSRKEVLRKISLLERALSFYCDKKEREFWEEYLGPDLIAMTKDRALNAITKLKEEHGKIPFGNLYRGPYYIRDYLGHGSIIKNEPLVLKNGFILWSKLDSNLNLWNYVKNPYKDSRLTTVLTAEDGEPIYSKGELRNSLVS